MRIMSGRFGRSTACGALALGLICGQLGINQSMAAEPKSRAARPAPHFNASDPILKCTAHGAKAASTYVVVQVPVDQMDDTSLAWEKSFPDTPVCVKVSVDDAVQFLSMARNNPNWLAAQWQPNADVLKAANAAPEPAKAVDTTEQAQVITDQAETAARGGDYTGALALAKKAADLGHPLDASEVAFWTKRSAQQEQAAADAAKLKAAQQAASATAQQIKDRQQKDYAERARKAALAKDDEPSAAQLGMQGQALGSYAQSVGSAIAQNVKNGSMPTSANAVGSTTFARNQPVALNGYRPASDCLTLEKVTVSVDNGPGGPVTVASNKCDFKVVFLWCVEGSGAGKACATNGALPQGLDTVEPHGRLTIVQQVAGLKVKTWACEAPGVPTTTTGSAYECR